MRSGWNRPKAGPPGIAGRALTVTVALVALACGGCASGGRPPPDPVTVEATNESGEPVLLRYTFGTSVPATLGNLRHGATETYTLRFNNAGDLRIIGDFVERRSGTSNPIVDLRPGDRLTLRINARKELRLDRAPGL